MITLNCYTDLHSFEEIKDFWMAQLKLPESCLRKSHQYRPNLDVSIVRAIWNAIWTFQLPNWKD